MAEKMVLVDGNSLMYRAFHALPLLDNGDGAYTNAVFGFLSMLMKVLRDEKPAYLAVAFDLHGPTFRHEKYPAYKAGRAPTPEELRPQFPIIKEILSAMGVRQLSLPGYEADDILGTMSRACEEQGVDAVLVTGDRDAFQLAGPHSSICYTKRGITDVETVTPEYLMEKYGLAPERMTDLKGLMGDASDNIPGVPGVGEKTALKLLKQYGTLEKTLERADAEQKGKLRERLIENAEQAAFSKELATICRSAPIDTDLAALRMGDLTSGLPCFEKYRLKTLAERLRALQRELGGAPAAEETAFRQWAKPAQAEDAEALRAWAEGRGGDLSVSLEGAGVSVALEDGSQVFSPYGGDLLNPGLSCEDALKALSGMLEAEGKKFVPSVKELLRQADAAGVAPAGEFFDLSLSAYCINPQRKSFRGEALCEAEGISPENATEAAKLRELAALYQSRLEKDGLERLYREIELPLAYTLRSMERVGFLVDPEALRALGDAYREKIDTLTARLRAIAGREINLNSPKQISQLLFEDLGLAGGKKKSGGYSTDADELERLAADSEAARLILAYRKYAKLNGTYVEALLRLRGADGRVHTSFDQTATATGRISSVEPNLQNIPVRTEEGRQIRRAFIAGAGNLLVDADYSQIELRVLAHMSGDEGMRGAFLRGEDIHKRTAAEVYGVGMDEVTPAMRSNAKAVNFGIVYGISDFGLAKNTGLTRGEAARFIERYFARYPLVQRYMDSQIALGKTEGYVRTLFGRRRYLEELSSSNYNTRSFGERAAMNSPIQGTAADIIKIAMNRVGAALAKASLKARLILQVHDELIVEAPAEEAEAVCAILKESMEGAADLSVPLVADLSLGGNWYECKE